MRTAWPRFETMTGLC